MTGVPALVIAAHVAQSAGGFGAAAGLARDGLGWSAATAAKPTAATPASD